MLSSLLNTSTYWTTRKSIKERGAIEDFETLEICLIIKNHIAAKRGQTTRWKVGKLHSNQAIHGSIHDGFSNPEFLTSLGHVAKNLSALIKRRVDRSCLEMKIRLKSRTLKEQEVGLEALNLRNSSKADQRYF
jgi:hypothetical protein